ncbi:hypothetical protein [uncultured Gulosibacter sp.]|uniref:hypothetical protein n=1 Tax=uncultured Gulosibacter sp. TaxID=1339167 RepID=UPI00288B11BF|nr:hypothetical protein [uncultured Gulosibacter sp.]
MAKPQRRVRTNPVPGADPTPQRFERDGRTQILGESAGEDRLERWGDFDTERSLEVRDDYASDSNDARLLADLPPHNVEH